MSGLVHDESASFAPVPPAEDSAHLPLVTFRFQNDETERRYVAFVFTGGTIPILIASAFITCFECILAILTGMWPQYDRIDLGMTFFFLLFTIFLIFLVLVQRLTRAPVASPSTVPPPASTSLNATEESLTPSPSMQATLEANNQASSKSKNSTVGTWCDALLSAAGTEKLWTVLIVIFMIGFVAGSIFDVVETCVWNGLFQPLRHPPLEVLKIAVDAAAHKVQVYIRGLEGCQFISVRAPASVMFIFLGQPRIVFTWPVLLLGYAAFLTFRYLFIAQLPGMLTIGDWHNGTLRVDPTSVLSITDYLPTANSPTFAAAWRGLGANASIEVLPFSPSVPFTAVDIYLLIFFIMTGVMITVMEWSHRTHFLEHIELENQLQDIQRNRNCINAMLDAMVSESVYQRLMAANSTGSVSILDYAEVASVLFSDVAGFTAWSSHRSPIEVVQMLNEMYRSFDKWVPIFGVEKVATVGDAYWACCGIPAPAADSPYLTADGKFLHAHRMLAFAVTMQDQLEELRRIQHQYCEVHIRIGVHSGPVSGGLVGVTSQMSYQIFGHTSEEAESMEQNAPVDGILMSEAMLLVLQEEQDPCLKFVEGDYDNGIPEVIPGPEVDGLNTCVVKKFKWRPTIFNSGIFIPDGCGDDRSLGSLGRISQAAGNPLQSAVFSMPIGGATSTAETASRNAERRQKMLDRLKGANRKQRQDSSVVFMEELGAQRAASESIASATCRCSFQFEDPQQERLYGFFATAQFVPRTTMLVGLVGLWQTALWIGIVLENVDVMGVGTVVGQRYLAGVVLMALSATGCLIVSLVMWKWVVMRMKRRDNFNAATSVSLPLGEDSVSDTALAIAAWTGLVVCLAAVAMHWIVALVTPPSLVSSYLDSIWCIYLYIAMVNYSPSSSLSWIACVPVYAVMIACPEILIYLVTNLSKLSLFVVVNILASCLVLWFIGFREAERKQRDQFLIRQSMHDAKLLAEKESVNMRAILQKSVPSFVVTELLEWITVGKREGVMAHQYDALAVMFCRVPSLDSMMVAASGGGDSPSSSRSFSPQPSSPQPMCINGQYPSPVSPSRRRRNTAFLRPEHIMSVISALVRAYDVILAQFPMCVKIKTIGDILFVCAGTDHRRSAGGTMMESLKSSAAAGRPVGGTFHDRPHHSDDDQRNPLGVGDRNHHHDASMMLLLPALQQLVAAAHTICDTFLQGKVGDTIAGSNKGMDSLSKATDSLSELSPEGSMNRFQQDYDRATASILNQRLPVQCGIHIGPAVGGVLGETKLVYDVFGDTVNTASRVMSSCGLPGVWLSEQAALLIREEEDEGAEEVPEIEADSPLPLAPPTGESLLALFDLDDSFGANPQTRRWGEMETREVKGKGTISIVHLYR